MIRKGEKMKTIKHVILLIKPYLWAVLVLAVFYGIGLWWGLKSEFSPSVDVPFPLGSLIFVGQYSDATEAAKYPALHYLLQLPFYGALMAFLMLTGGFSDISSKYPYGFADPVMAFTIMQLITRAMSVVMGIGMLIALWKTRHEATRPRSHLLAIALLALSGPFTFYAREANLDVPYNFWWALAVLFGWRYLFDTQKARPDLLWAGAFSALSLATKDAVAGALLGLGLAILFLQPAGQRLSWAQRIKNILWFGLPAAGVYLLVAVAPQPARWWYHLSLWTLGSESVAGYVVYPATLAGYLGLVGATFWNLGVLVSPVGILLVLLGFYVLVRSKQVSKAVFFLLPAITYFVVIILNIRFVYERFMLPVAVVMVPVMGVGAAYLVEHASRVVRRGGLALTLLGVIFQFVVGYLPVTYMHLYDTKRQLAESIDQYVVPGSPIMTELDGVTHFPNADVYTRYRLMLPEGQKPPLKSEEHLYADYAPGAHCLLSSNPLEEAAGGMKRVASWEYPDFVSWFVMNHVIDEFYLYDIDGNCKI